MIVWAEIPFIGPDNHSVAVHQVVEICCLRIVGESHRIRSYLPDYGRIFFVVHRQEGVASLCAVLVAAHPA